MLGRRILRIKTFKALYSYAENPTMSLADTEALMEISCESTRDLQLYLLSLACSLTQEAVSRMEAVRTKFNLTEEERNPNTKFIDNKIAKILAEDPDFNKLIKKKKFSWEQCDVFLRHLFETVREREYFKEYMSSGNSSLEEDAALFSKIFSEELENNEEIPAILEDMSIYWNDDLSYAVLWCCRTFEDLGKGKPWRLLPLYQSDLKKGTVSDKAYITGILRKAYSNYENYCHKVAELTPQWPLDRICVTDLCLIACGIAEHEAFPDTPVKIIINEYVEISKFYSTPDSRSFVNGLLDKLINK